MWDDVGLLRTEDGLARAIDVILAWQADAVASATVAEHEDANLLLLAAETASAARNRTASVGAHYLEAPHLERV
jgi:L-aspartate oxidase